MQKMILTALAVLCLGVISMAQPVAGQVFYLPMNGNLIDLGPNNISVTNTGVTATTNVAGIQNNAMYFANPSTTTVTNYATVASNVALNFTGDFSFSFAFYLSSPYLHNKGFFDNGINPVSNGFGYGMWLWNANGYNSIVFSFRNGALQSTAAGNIQLGVWNHASFVRQAGTLKIYINGVLNTSGPEGTSTLGYNGHNIRIGTMNYVPYTPQQYNGLNGSMDELRAFNRAITNTEVTQLYNAWLVSQSLPVHLTAFNVSLINNNPILSWKTGFEQNSSHFTVQRSYDGVNFEAIANITAKGNSNTETAYNYTDNAVFISANTKTVFYRLQQYDADGKSELSNILSVKYSNPKTFVFTILQNPVPAQLQLQLQLTATQQVLLQITDAQGRIIKQQKNNLSPGRQMVLMPVAELASGVYHITVITATEKQTQSFIKN